MPNSNAPTPTLKDYIDNFEVDYSPYHEWLLTCAYAYITATTNPITAITMGYYSVEETDNIEDLINELANHQNRIDLFLMNSFGISEKLAKDCQSRIERILQEMMQYRQSVYNKIDHFHENEFFKQFDDLSVATRKFCYLVWGYENAKLMDFALYLILDYYHRNDIQVPSTSNNNLHVYSAEEVSWIVLGDLLFYFSRTPSSAWAPGENPVLTNTQCPHNGRIVMVGKEWLCDDCGAVEVDTMWDDDYNWEFGYGITI